MVAEFDGLGGRGSVFMGEGFEATEERGFAYSLCSYYYYE
jgi:hypothetical protein